MNFLSVNQISKFYGARLLFDNISFFIEKGQKVALIARNGSGKSTLLKILQGKEPPESGDVRWATDLTVGFLDQEPEFDNHMTVYEAILHADNPLLRICLQYENALDGRGDISKAMSEMDRLHAWDYEVRVKQILSKFKINRLEQQVGLLSGGQKKRLALSILLLTEPEFLILDEPTNHLDMDMIEWLEEYLSASQITLFMVTHDRYFLENVCNEILELEDNTLYRHRGSYSKYLENKLLREENLKANTAKAQNTMRKELEWIRRQPQARATKSRARIDAFESVKERASQKIVEEKVHLDIKMNRLGGKILELHNICKSFGNQKVIDKFSYKFAKGERVGIVGNNGSGKTTFLNVIMNKEPIDSGKLIHGETVVWGYYRQQGMTLKEDKRVIEVVKDIAEVIPVGKGTLSAAQLLERFLFDREQQYQYVSTLSGGEKRRLFLLTILMKNPNFLILDEPTNDLDIMTLQVLEDFLAEYQGCLLLVSHDRYFLDKLTDHLFIFEGDGQIKDFNGNYSDYRIYLKEKDREKKGITKVLENKEVEQDNQSKNPDARRKLSYKEKKELEQIEKDLEQIEEEKKQITTILSSGMEDYDQIRNLSDRLEWLVAEQGEKELRWLELSEFAD